MGDRGKAIAESWDHDERGQGQSERVDPETLSLEVFARDVDLLAGALGLDRFALLGHSFGAIVTTWHATELGTAAAYVASARSRRRRRRSDVLRYFANIGYGDFDYRPRLRNVRRPTLVVVGEHDRTTTPRAAHVLHEGIEGSELVVVPGVGHMSFVESQARYLEAVRSFLRAESAA
jgi:pimeloyl-ACP methyl ester carboxylesterase